MAAPTVSERLAATIVARMNAGVPGDVRHQAKRLVLNALKGSVNAFDHPTIETLHAWERAAAAAGRPAHVLWHGGTLAAESAAFVNAAMLEILDFNENHTENGPLHPTAPVLPAVLAEAERVGASGARVLDALAIGVEVELAVATMLMWSTYRRGFMTGVLVGGVGAAAGCCALRGLGVAETAHALGFAMTCAHGAMENFGSASHATNLGLASRNGLLASVLAERGLVTAETAFEGKKGMRSSYSDEPQEKAEQILEALAREPWARIFEPAFKSLPTETISHAPVTCALELARRVSEERRLGVATLRFHTHPLVAEIAGDRYAQFGRPLATDLQAKFDQRYCVAAAWRRARFGHEEMRRQAYTDTTILDLRDRVETVAHPAIPIEGARLDAIWPDGSVERASCDWFLGTPRNPLSDEALAALFAEHAQGRVPDSRIGDLVDAVWELDAAPDVGRLVALAQAG